MKSEIKFNELASEIHEANKAKGFWDMERTNIECLALAAGECHEAIEADRKGKYMKLSERSKEQQDAVDEIFIPMFKNHVKDTMEDEIADAIIRLLDFCSARNIDIDWHIRNKLRYNSTRERLHGKKY